jgi:hypothetical protein
MRQHSKVTDAMVWMVLTMDENKCDYIYLDDIKKYCPGSPTTWKRVKRQLKLVSDTKEGRYIWHKPEYSENKTIPQYHYSPTVREYDPRYAYDTAALVEDARWMYMNNVPYEEAINRLAQATLNEPNKIPYPIEYIKSIAMHGYESTPIDQTLNPNRDSDKP